MNNKIDILQIRQIKNHIDDIVYIDSVYCKTLYD